MKLEAFILLVLESARYVSGFAIIPKQGGSGGRCAYVGHLKVNKPSKVEDVGDAAFIEEEGEEETPMEIVDVDSLEGLHYRELPDNPDKPWRRGDTDGCDDPMDAPWRIQGEKVIYEAADSIGAVIDDVTWDMAKCTITLSDTSKVKKKLDDYLVERQKREDAYPYMREEREAIITEDAKQVDSEGVSVTAGTIIEALQKAEDEDDLDVLSRHEILVTSPGVSNILETQKQFDAFKGFDVIVQTIDPLGSNRRIEGKLMGRDAMDTSINKKGRTVTIPNNFVDYVELPKAKREKGDNML